MPKGSFAWLRAAVVFFVVTASATPIVYQVAVSVHPPVTSDGHRVMPIGQVALAIVVGPLLGIAVAIRFRRRKCRDRFPCP